LPTHDHEAAEPSRLPREAPAERSFWAMLPRRNFRRALFLLVALVAILVMKRMGGFSFARIFDGVAPAPAPAERSPPPFQHLEVKR
jgi:hypothetical protein